MKKKDAIPYILAIFALLIGAFYDYQITNALYRTDSILGILFERFALLPVQLMVVITMCMLARSKHRCFLFLAQVASSYLCIDFVHYWLQLDLILILITLVVSCMLTWIVYLFVQRMSLVQIQKNITFFVFFTCVLLTAMLITFLLKNGWGRIRYRDLTDPAQFCVWYEPCLLFGNQSFPSGHTTAFTAILCFLQFKRSPQQPTSVTRVLVISLLILLMPLTRMMMGAHFLSDTAMGFIITYSCYLMYRTYFKRGGRL